MILDKLQRSLFAGIILVLFFSACKKEESPEPAEEGWTCGTPSAYIYGKVGSDNEFYYEYSMSEVLGGNHGATGEHYYACQSARFSGEADTEIEIFVNHNFLSSSSPSDEDIVSLYSEGTYTYANKDLMGNGVSVRYLDEAGKEWTTYFGSGDQSDSHFNLTPVQLPYEDPDMRSHIPVQGEFSCVLYDGSGAFVTLKATSFTGYFLASIAGI